MLDPRADDFEDEESPVEALPGSPPSDPSADELGPLLLGLIADVARLQVLLEETDEAEFTRVEGRLVRLLKAVFELPTGPGHEAPRVGFRGL